MLVAETGVAVGDGSGVEVSVGGEVGGMGVWVGKGVVARGVTLTAVSTPTTTSASPVTQAATSDNQMTQNSKRNDFISDFPLLVQASCPPEQTAGMGI
ncbi:MAG: hypothetical protein R3C62_05915 [Chloroflexota bacterium]